MYKITFRTDKNGKYEYWNKEHKNVTDVPLKAEFYFFNLLFFDEFL